MKRSVAMAKSRSICMLLHGGFPMEVRVAAEVRAAVSAGFDVDVIALRRPGELAYEEAEGARVFRLPLSHAQGTGAGRVALEYLGFTVLAGLKAARLAARRRYDIVQVHNPPDFLLVAALGPRLRGAHVILDVHDLATDMFAMRFEGRRGFGLVDRVLRVIERRAVRWSDAVLTVHEPYRQELIARGANADKVTVVLNTLDERVLPDDAVDPAADGFRIVYHGTITPHYGVQLLVEAGAALLESLPDLRLELYGEGDALAGIIESGRTLGLEDQLTSIPHLPQREVLRAVRGASVGVVPNLPTTLNRFALSTKLFEYVALGIPVVCADLPTIQSYFSPDEVMFFRAGDSGALAKAIEAVASDPAAAAARAVAARRRYEQYTWSVNERRYVELLERLITC
jgi:glycosyltransferase involved in cell wall biosynthesis